MASQTSPGALAPPPPTALLAPASGYRLPGARLQMVDWRQMTGPEAIARWDTLAQLASEPNPFFESWYLLPSLRGFDPQGHVQLLQLEAGGQLVALMPLVRPSRYYNWPLPHMASWLHPNCFCGAPLVAAGHEVAFWHALLSWADSNAHQALFLHLAQMPMEGPLMSALSVILDDQRRPNALVHRERRAVLQSDLSPEAYFEAAVHGRKRKNMARIARRLSEQGDLGVQHFVDGRELERWMLDFLTLEAAGWKGSAGSALDCAPATRTLFREALAGAATRGRLDRLALTLDGRPIAMLATFITPPGAFAFKTAFDERLAAYSPGVMLQKENLRLLNRPGLAWADSCADEEHPMISHLWRERREFGRLSIAIGGGLRRMLFRQIVRAELARSPKGME